MNIKITALCEREPHSKQNTDDKIIQAKNFQLPRKLNEIIKEKKYICYNFKLFKTCGQCKYNFQSIMCPEIQM